MSEILKQTKLNYPYMHLRDAPSQCLALFLRFNAPTTEAFQFALLHKAEQSSELVVVYLLSQLRRLSSKDRSGEPGRKTLVNIVTDCTFDNVLPYTEQPRRQRERRLDLD